MVFLSLLYYNFIVLSHGYQYTLHEFTHKLLLHVGKKTTIKCQNPPAVLNEEK